ncbi:MAG: DUF1801 domain-containing protein [Gammaproteobacteria bacterium]|nr:DUF1801 domain-containing protein [Gammaproteobacteria bacterium]
MAKNQNKTVATDQSVRQFIDSVDNEIKRTDSLALLDMMADITNQPPVMWGSSLIGFGTYHYKYASGREGDFFLTGFSPRKQALTIYIMPGFSEYDEILEKLGKYKTGKSCLYIKKLEDVDHVLLRELISKSVAYMRDNYETL